MTTVSEFEARTLAGKPVALRDYQGKVLLIVNTASKCGFTPQYKGLEELYRKYKDRGLVVLGFPCNQFLAQEPGNSEEIGAFCASNFGVSFPMFEKIEVNGPAAHPLYRWLKDARRGVLGTQRIKWNFTKFLLDRKGAPVRRYAPRTEPQKLEKEIEALL
ncbi:MAG TPA: glutathione peroxidase [Steroidobacteraceae bacterium]|jgi:glutathione peroxidase|nr:glutathione peroxidase [Steroidobacteraceae bacterium]